MIDKRTTRYRGQGPAPVTTCMLSNISMGVEIVAAIFPSGRVVTENILSGTQEIFENFVEAISAYHERYDAHGHVVSYRPFIMPTFSLVRKEDVSGVSGTGEVANGIVFLSGKVAMEWSVEPFNIGLYTSQDALIKTHGHDGKAHPAFHQEKMHVK